MELKQQIVLEIKKCLAIIDGKAGEALQRYADGNMTEKELRCVADDAGKDAAHDHYKRQTYHVVCLALDASRLDLNYVKMHVRDIIRERAGLLPGD